MKTRDVCSLAPCLLLFTLATSVAGACINIKQCPAALKYLDDFKNNRLHNSSLQILREAYCGARGSETKVFCEKIPSCYEPSDRNFCVRPKDCCVALRLVSLNVTQYPDLQQRLQGFTCSSESNEITVKCTSLLEVEEMLLKATSDGSNDDVCVTPSGFKGRCIHWQSCPTFKGKPMNTNYLDYLKWSVCDSKNHKICCGVNENIDDVCGLDNTSTDKIAGGRPTGRNEYPWVVILRYGDPGVLCGGSLINSQFVLTAAHCMRPDLRHVRIGGNFHNETDIKLEYDIIARRTHPSYKPRPLKFDIALLKIERVQYSDSVRWICLPPPTEILPREFLIVGNGLTENDRRPSKVQLKATLPLLDLSQCEKKFRNYLGYTFVICAGGQAGVDACPGDSGGPLMSKDDASVWKIYGIVSGGTADCRVGSPGFYTRVDLFLNWIKTNMKGML